jgi:hypothetical protein
MKKYIIFAISLLAIALMACVPEYKTGDKVSGSYVVITDKTDTLFVSPCGRVWIENPVAVENGGHLLSGAAVDSHPFVTVIWANNYREVVMRDYWYYGQVAQYHEIVKNVQMDKYITIDRLPCVGTVTRRPDR